MKVLIKQKCEIQDMVLGPERKDKPGTHDVPGSFVHEPTFVALMKDGKAEILDASDEDFENMPEDLQGLEPDAVVLDALKALSDKKEEAYEKTTSTSDDSSDVDSVIVETKVVVEEQHIVEADGDVKDIKKTTTTKQHKQGKK